MATVLLEQVFCVLDLALNILLWIQAGVDIHLSALQIPEVFIFACLDLLKQIDAKKKEASPDQKHLDINKDYIVNIKQIKDLLAEEITHK